MKAKIKKSKNSKLLAEFANYCIKHPQERFWQALCNFSGAYKIWREDFNQEVDDYMVHDTFYD